jgi:hypothetical protein
MGLHPSTVASIPCDSRPAVTAVFQAHLLLACNGGPVKEIILVSTHTGRTALLLRHRMAAPIMAYANWTGKYVEWYAEQWTEPGGFSAWGVSDGDGRPAPASVRQELSVAATASSLNDLKGDLFILRGHTLEQWHADHFTVVGRLLPDQRLVAAGGGRVVVETLNSTPSGAIKSVTYTLESLNPLRKIISWDVRGDAMAGMVYSISYSCYGFDLYFPLQHKHYVRLTGYSSPPRLSPQPSEACSPDISNGQIYFPALHGYERLVVGGRSTSTMVAPPGIGGLWP